MTDNELVDFEEEIVEVLARYKAACTEFDIDFDASLESLVDRAKE